MRLDVIVIVFLIAFFCTIYYLNKNKSNTISEFGVALVFFTLAIYMMVFRS